MAQWPGTGPDVKGWQLANGRWLLDNEGCRRDILELLRSDGPLTARELPDTCARPWRSSGWNNNRNVVMMLEVMVHNGDVAVAGRRGRDRLWDLAERIYPDDPGIPADEARRLRDERRLRSLGLARSRGPDCLIEPLDVGEAGEPAVVEGVRGQWRVDPAALDGPFEGRAALISPFDRLFSDRKRMVELFEFDYALEMFKPVAARRWGYYALPVLWRDQVVGWANLQAAGGQPEATLGFATTDVSHEPAFRAALDEELQRMTQFLAPR